jgi:hypothetical protein
MTSEEDKEYDKAFADVASLRDTRTKLSSMTDGELALWHAEQKPGSAEFVLTDHEWRSRLLVKQNRATYGAAVVGIVGVVVGVFLGWYLTLGNC